MMEKKNLKKEQKVPSHPQSFPILLKDSYTIETPTRLRLLGMHNTREKLGENKVKTKKNKG